MECRPGCAACCISISISSALPGLPLGKPAGVRCVNLSTENWCGLWGTRDYPAVCQNFRPDPNYCGETNAEAFQRLGALETSTAPQRSTL